MMRERALIELRNVVHRREFGTNYHIKIFLREYTEGRKSDKFPFYFAGTATATGEISSSGFS